MAAESARALVKICGLRDEGTIAGMAGLPVDYVGFMFARSKRQVSPAQAAALLKAARNAPMAGGSPPRTVGVFVNPSMEELAETLGTVTLDVVQLHGDETPAFAREVGERFGVEVWRALPAELSAYREDHADNEAETIGDADAVAARLEAYRGAVAAVLIDTAGGGTGRTFNWDLIPAYKRAAEAGGLKLFVAGGLSPENVGELLSDYAPDGVDISSGVETDGTKDPAKIAAFVERVKQG